MKKIILCADDFGENKSVSDGILDLLQQKRLSATSCMTNMPYWPTAAQQLKALNLNCQVGLHFNLTEGQPLSGQPCFAPLNTLILRSHLHALNRGWIAQELSQQIEAFKNHYGRLPDFIDGHQHVHHLPQIRKALLSVYEEYFPNKEAYIRVSSGSLGAAAYCPKVLVIALSGARMLKKELKKRHIPHNTSFSGIYNFSPTADYPRLFKRFLKESHNGGLIMCHPAKEPLHVNDSIAQARIREYRHFSSDEFLLNLSSLGVCIRTDF